MPEDIELTDIAAEVRNELNHIYKFQDSKYGIFAFDPINPNSKFFEILKTSGMNDTSINAKLTEYKNNIVGATCLYMPEKSDYNYIILIPSGSNKSGELYLIIGEETMHGEHATRHRKFNQNTNVFSGVAREFFGGSGQCHIARKVCEIPSGKCLPDEFMKSTTIYNEVTDTFNFDISHMVGYDLAKQAVTGENEWKSRMFHEPDEKKLWSIYNEALVPDIKIMVPPAMENKDDIKRDIDVYIKSLGLKCNIDIAVDETDTRGMRS